MQRESINNDRLSDLCDSIILHILSFLNTKQALQTCILSTRWKNITKHLPVLRLYPSQFKCCPSFRISVLQALSLRDHSTTLHTVDLIENSYDVIETDVLKRIVAYAVSHNVQFLRTTITRDLQICLPCLFSSQTLTVVELCVPSFASSRKILFPNSLNFPSLTKLTLRSFYFCAGDDGCAEPFSVFNKLNTLVIQDCRLQDTQSLCISSTTLVNLTVDERRYDDSYICKLLTPSLCNLNYLNTLNQKLCRSHLCSFKHVHIDIITEKTRIFTKYYPLVLNLLQELANIKSLTVSYTTLQVLSLVPDLSKVKLTSLYNLESLQVKWYPCSSPLYQRLNSLPCRELSKLLLRLRPRTIEPNKIVNFLLQNSPLAKVEVI